MKCLYYCSSVILVVFYGVFDLIDKLNNFSIIFSAGFFFTLIFFSTITIISGILGMIWLNSFAVLVISFVVTCFFFTNFELQNIKISPWISVLSLIAFIMLIYPVLIITPFFPASADAITSTVVRILGDQIPSTMAPFTELDLGYQIGFPLLVNVFSDLFNFMPDYLWAWILSAFFGVAQLIGIYLFTSEYFSDKLAGTWAAILFLGSKLVFENHYVGEYSWEAATALMIFSFYFILKKNNAFIFTLPVFVSMHPAVALNAIILSPLIIPKMDLKIITKIVVSMALAFPALLINYLPIAINLLSGSISSGESPHGILYYLSILPPWIGLVPISVFMLLVLFFFMKRIVFSTKLIIVIATTTIGFAAYLIFGQLSIMLVGRVVEVISIGIIVSAGYMLSSIKLDKKKSKAIAFTVLLLVLVVFSSSSILNHYRSGSKISPDEAAFAIEFKNFDPELEPVLFLSQNPGKIAEFSNKIPYTIGSAHTISLVKLLYYGNVTEVISNRYKNREEILNGCIECIDNLNVKYVVVNKEYTEIKPTYKEIFSSGKFSVYYKE